MYHELGISTNVVPGRREKKVWPRSSLACEGTHSPTSHEGIPWES
jgi:hypothetical protein